MAEIINTMRHELRQPVIIRMGCDDDDTTTLNLLLHLVRASTVDPKDGCFLVVVEPKPSPVFVLRWA